MDLDNPSNLTANKKDRPTINRQKNGQFGSGNKEAKGRPPGPTVAGKLRQRVLADFDEIVESLITQAKAGDVAAATLLLSRTCPPMKAVADPIKFHLTEGDLTDKAEGILKETSNGALPVDDGTKLISSLASVAKLREIDDMERRLAAIEEKMNKRRAP